MSALERLKAAAKRWADYDYEPRREAVENALRIAAAAGRRWTEEGCEHALNSRMHALARATGLPESVANEPSVAICTAANAPFSAFDAVAAVLTSGVSASVVAPFELEMERRFLHEAGIEVEFRRSNPEVRAAIRLDEEASTFSGAELLLDLSDHHVHALLGPQNSESDLLALAEDVLLHDGQARTSVRLVWAPAGYEPDLFIAALDAFRDELAAHPGADGALKMGRAFLASSEVAHAWGDGYLMSKGSPEAQAPGHLRWVEYEDVDSAVEQIVAMKPQAVVSSLTQAQLPPAVRRVSPGDAHRPPLGGYDREAIREFVAKII